MAQGTALMAGPTSPLAPHVASPIELKAQLEALRGDTPFLVYRDRHDKQRLVPLGPEVHRLTVGRRETNDIALEWDEEVSRLHAEFDRVGDEWTVVDDGLSQNGTYLNGVRVNGRRRLRDRDTVRFGNTVVAFRSPAAPGSLATRPSEARAAAPHLSDGQRRVLIALCRPYRESTGFATPASNKQIADELFVTVDAVKATLRALFGKFGVDDLPQNEKRMKLVEHAFRAGAVSEDDLC